ncbi:cytochrome P450 [Geopyxis carbonaria]|nr:cytochrome P450 [Geopyxis carbonaria]
MHENKLIKQYGCKPAVMLYSPYGLQMMKDFGEFMKKKKVPTMMHYWLQQKPETNTVRVDSLGTTTIVTNEPRNLQVMLATEFDNFRLGGFRERCFKPFIGSGIFTQDGHEWSISRALLRPAFELKNSTNFGGLELHIQRIYNHILDEPADEEGFRALDLEPLLSKFSLDVVTELLFGKTSDQRHAKHVSTKEEQDFVEAWEIGQHWMVDRAKAGPLCNFVTSKKARAACATVQKYADQFVDQSIERYKTKTLINNTDSGRYVFLDEIVQQTQDREILRSQCLNVLFAGRETLAALIAWTLFWLRKTPRVHRKLVEEVEKKFGVGLDARLPTYEQMWELTYLQWVLRETHRLNSPAPGNGRECSKTTVLPLGGGPDGKSPLLVRRGDLVHYSTYSMCRRKDLYGESAEEYLPERWGQDAPGEGLRKIGWGYLPFSGGPRNCAGQKFANTTATYALIRIIQLFPDLKPAPNPNHSEDTVLYRVGMTNTVDHGVWLNFK